MKRGKKTASAGGRERQRPETKALPESATRERTRWRLRHLLLAAAATGAGACDPMVCDPLPPPLRCQTERQTDALLEHVSAYGTWETGDTGLVARVGVSANSYGVGDPLAIAGDPLLAHATLVRVVERQEDYLKFDCLPDAGATSVDVTVPLSCNGLGACFRVRLDVSRPQAGLPVLPTEWWVECE